MPAATVPSAKAALDPDRALDDVGAGEQVPVPVMTLALPAPAPCRVRTLTAATDGQHRLRDAHDRRRVGVERLLVVHATSVDP